jgi:hypothetical protein
MRLAALMLCAWLLLAAPARDASSTAPVEIQA